jgi:hypothetical protein
MTARLATHAAELLGGLWLIGGFHPSRAHDLALATFAGLAAASLFQVVAGKCSCGCFGALIIDPWFMLILDVAVVTALWWSRPQTDSDAWPIFNPPDLIGVGAVAVVVAAGGWSEAGLVSVGERVTKVGEPLRNTSVTLTGGSDAIHLVTDGDGNFRLPYIRPGTYAASREDGSHVATPITAPIVRSPRIAGTDRRTQQAEGRSNLSPSRSLIWIEIESCSRSDTPINF